MPRKVGLVFLSSLLLFSAACAGSPANDKPSSRTASPFFLSANDAGGLVFIGAAGRRSDPKDTLQFALEDAARKVAIYYDVSGECAVQNNIGSGLLDYTYNAYTALYYDKEGAVQYVDALQFDADTDTMETDNTFFVRVTYPAALPVPVRYRPVYARNGKPDWVDNPPLEIEGYEVGLGYSARHSSMADTYTNSFNNAIFSIIRNINTASQSSYLYYQNTGSLFGYKTASDNTTYSYGTLAGFYVLDMWIDPRTKAVSTLAIAKKL
jgi:hypothetical protein